VLITWTVAFPIRYETVQNIDMNVMFQMCSFHSPSYTTLWVFNCIITLGIFVLAWKVRKIQEEIGDSRRIFYFLIFLLPFNIIYTVGVFTAEFDIFGLGYTGVFKAISITEILSLTLNSVLPVGFLVLPRAYYVWYEHKHNGQLPESVQTKLFGVGQVQVRGVSGNTNSTKDSESQIATNNGSTGIIQNDSKNLSMDSTNGSAGQ
jgi:hypothetical protein